MTQKLKEERQLSGIFFRFQNTETGKWENRVFEDLPIENQDLVMAGRSEEWLQALAKQLANTINKIAEQFDISANPDNKPS